MVARKHPSFSQALDFPSFSQAINCFVSFNFGPGFPNVVLEVIPGQRVQSPAVPQRTGFQFGGWFLETDFITEWDFNNTVCGRSFTLYARWIAVAFNITYFLNHGINHPDNPGTYTVEDPDIVLENPTRGEDEFIAWYEDAMFSRAPIEIIRTQNARDVYLYARFLSRRTVVFDSPEVVDSRYEGDPKLFLEPNGASLRYEAGQPVMERGLENQAFISLFTREGWCGNAFLLPENQIGSDFEATCSGSITRSKLADIENSAVRALTSKAFQKVDTRVYNPRSDNLLIEITVRGGAALTLAREGALWQNQRERS